MTSNLAASVRARLTNHAKSSKRPFEEVLQHYGLERLLYRVAQSRHRSRFVLKGALLLHAWNAPVSRPTRDIDLLGYAKNDLVLMQTMFREICELGVVDDGLRFDTTTLVARRIREDAEYQGVRLSFLAFLEKARIPIQIDIGFGDVVSPGPEKRDYPALLNLPAARLRTYPRETVVAEKFHAMVQLGSLNTRMKDFFDVWLLANHFDFSGAVLAEAFGKTFAHRGTPLDAEPIGLTWTFTSADSTQKQWTAFIKRSHLLDTAPKTLEDARVQLRSFLLPIATALVAAQRFTSNWTAPGPWRSDA